ncbi:MAG: hypothetical protein ACI8P9_001892 [Parasphingorhabdus sp.]|jgi:hypothetical protein
MVKQDISNENPIARSSDLANAEIALRRAGVKVREIARQNGTSVVYSINGKIVHEIPTNEGSPD